MFIGEFEKKRKSAKVCSRHSLVIVGGGLTGVCCAITAARAGTDVALIQDRPVLGGNASSEVRLWALGATSHMGNNNRWSREGGVIDEILVENTFRNQEGNPVLFDMVLIDKVLSEPNITLYLNTCVYDAEMSGRTVRSVTAFNPQTGTTRSKAIFSPTVRATAHSPTWREPNTAWEPRTAKNTARSSRPTRPDTASCWGTASCSTSRTRGVPYASKLPNSP